MSEDTAEPKGRPAWVGWVTTAVKLSIAAGLLYWILNKPEFEWSKLGVALTSQWVVPILGLVMLALCCSGLRWLVLLRGEGIRVSLWTALRLTFIGHFWNMVIPGAVSGDAVKMYYIGQVAPDRRHEAWTTVFADRAIGLAALVAVAATAALIQFEEMWARPQLRALMVVMVCALVAFVVGMIVVGTGIGRTWAITQRVEAWLPEGVAELVRRAYGSLHRTCRRPKVVAITFSISVFAHGLAVVNMFLLGRALQETVLSLAQYAALTPVALFSNAIPLTPGGGIGVGESVIGQLFEWSGGSSGKGAMIMIAYRVMFFATAILGAGLYAFYRHQDPALAGMGDASDPEPAP